MLFCHWQGANSEDTDIVFNILSQLHTAVGSDEDISDQDQVGCSK